MTYFGITHVTEVSLQACSQGKYHGRLAVCCFSDTAQLL